MKRRFVAVILCLCVSLALLPTVVLADEQPIITISEASLLDSATTLTFPRSIDINQSVWLANLTLEARFPVTKNNSEILASVDSIVVNMNEAPRIILLTSNAKVETSYSGGTVIVRLSFTGDTAIPSGSRISVDTRVWNKDWSHFTAVGGKTPTSNFWYPSTAPATNVCDIEKASAVQSRVDFTLTNTPAYADGRDWIVYANAIGDTLASGVTASNVGNNLTLSHPTDVPASTYFVAVIESGKTESNRLALTVGAYVPPAISKTPMSTATTIAKASATQASVNFTLTNSPALIGTWRVYSGSIGDTLATGVTASASGSTLTLSHASDIPAATYYVSFTEAGKAESTRLALTVGAYVPQTTYTITYNPSGGSVTPTSAATGTDGKLSALPTPTRSGSYSFSGWYTAVSGGTQVTTSHAFSADSTIYAQWNYAGSSSSGKPRTAMR